MVRSLVCFLGMNLVFVAVASAQTTGTGGTGGTGVGTIPGLGTTTGNTGGTSVTAQQGQGVNIDNIGLDTSDLITGGITRGNTIGASRTTVRGFSILENQKSQSGQTGQNGRTSNTQRRTNSRGTGSTFGGGGGAGLNSGGSLGGMNRNSAGNTQRRTILRSRVVLSNDLVVPSAMPNATATSVYVPANAPQLSNVQVDIQKNTAIVSGSVASPQDRDLASRLLLLQPGIDRVQVNVNVDAPQQ